jgi:hypothetical protein
MKITFLSILLFATLIFGFPTSVFAKEVEISSNSSYSPTTQDFSAGQTIYIRVKFDTDYQNVNLKLDDNNSKTLKTIAMTGVATNTYVGSITAPSDQNYYLIRIEASSGEGKKSTTVRTIKIGEPQSASLNVNIENKANGEEVKSNEESSTTNTTINTNISQTTIKEEDDEDDKSEENVSIIRQEITAESEVSEPKNEEQNEGVLNTILFVTNPMLFVAFLFVS